MSFTKFFILFFILVVIISCNKSDDPVYPHEARVIGVNTDCGIYAIQFLSDLDEIIAKFGNTPFEGIYIGRNLSFELQEDYLLIQLNCRVPEPNEVGACSKSGPSYTWVFITDAKKE
jgi:hypothetical protein